MANRLKLLGITYLVGKIKFKRLFYGPFWLSKTNFFHGIFNYFSKIYTPRIAELVAMENPTMFISDSMRISYWKWVGFLACHVSWKEIHFGGNQTSSKLYDRLLLKGSPWISPSKSCTVWNWIYIYIYIHIWIHTEDTFLFQLHIIVTRSFPDIDRFDSQAKLYVFLVLSTSSSFARTMRSRSLNAIWELVDHCPSFPRPTMCTWDFDLETTVTFELYGCVGCCQVQAI